MALAHGDRHELADGALYAVIRVVKRGLMGGDVDRVGDHPKRFT